MDADDLDDLLGRGVDVGHGGDHTADHMVTVLQWTCKKRAAFPSQGKRPGRPAHNESNHFRMMGVANCGIA